MSHRVKNVNWLVRTIETGAIVAVSLAAGYALLGTSAGFLIPCAALTLLGILTVVLFRIGTVPFGASAIGMSVPALMKVNGIQWWVFSPERLAFCPNLGVPAATAIGLLVVGGTLLLGYLQSLQTDVTALQKGGTGPEEIRQYATGILWGAGAALVLSIAAAVISVTIFALVRKPLSHPLSAWSWAVPAGGLATFALLVAGWTWLVKLRART